MEAESLERDLTEDGLMEAVRVERDLTEDGLMEAVRVERDLMVRLILYSSATCLVCVLEAQTPLTHSSVLRQFSF